MAERKPGRVKPPTIELTARPVATGNASETTAAQAEEPAAEAVAPPQAADAPELVQPAAAETAEAPPSEPPSTPPPPPPPFVAERPAAVGRAGQPWDAIALSAVAGALLGTALTYVMATLVPLPSSAPDFTDPTPQLADVGRRLDNLEGSSATIADQATRTQVSLDATISQLDTGLAELRKAIDDAVSRVPAPADLSSVEERLRAVSSRLDAVAAGASSADSEALAQTLTQLQSSLSGVSARLDALERARGATESTLTALQATLGTLEERLGKKTEAEQQAVVAVDRAAQADALRAAIEKGGAFAGELAAISESSGATVSPELQAKAAAGLPNPEVLAQRFAARVPDIIAARPSPQGEDWQGQAVDWMKSMLAVRPADVTEGDSPEAVMSRLEAAMARYDFTQAAELFDQLPAPMKAAAGDVATDVALWAAANALIADLRKAPAEAAQ